MSKKLYVGNLSYSTNEDELRRMFAEVGVVTSVNVITDRETGRSKGFGFVEMESDDAAQQAIERYNNTEIGGRRIAVNEARPPAERPFGGGGARGGRGGGGDRGGRGGGGGGGGDRGGRGGGGGGGGGSRRY